MSSFLSMFNVFFAIYLIILSVNVRIVMSNSGKAEAVFQCILSVQTHLRNTDIVAIELNIQIFFYICQ